MVAAGEGPSGACRGCVNLRRSARMPHNFDEELKLDKNGFLERATGPVDPPNETMFWIAAFVYQNEPPGHYAAAWGTDEWPNGVQGQWECQTDMAPDSQPFNEGEAYAWALARVTDGGGKFFAWGDKVTLKK
jgi:hypothetical protein